VLKVSISVETTVLTHVLLDIGLILPICLVNNVTPFVKPVLLLTLVKPVYVLLVF
jgi:hypothetical protein